jgi:thioredoxin-disulfide reductase
MDKVYDVVIVGAGPGGMSAAIYAKRAGLDTLLLERAYVSGGQIINTMEIDNYPGLPRVGGMELANKLKAHVEEVGIISVQEEVAGVSLDNELKRVLTKNHQYITRNVIIATGARHRRLGIIGEQELTGLGVSYCATCDGSFFKNKTVAVIGGGDVAVEDALYLSRMCKQVYLIHRRDMLRAAKVLQERLLSAANIMVLWNQVPEQIIGEGHVERILLRDVNIEITQEVAVDGVFVAVGMSPNSDTFKDVVELDESGYIKAGEDCRTNVAGVYVIGDVRTKELRQIITAAADGANVVTSVQGDIQLF